VVSLLGGVGLMVGNGRCIIGQSSSRKDQSVMIVSSIVSWFPESEREGGTLSRCCREIDERVSVVRWQLFDEGSWSFLVRRFGFATGFGV